MDTQNIKQVIVVFKTHLDIGFTGMAADVLRRYREEFIPAAVALAEQANQNGKKRFVWTVGSYLVQHYLAHADAEACARFVAAIVRGDIRWHGLACTTHTELMSRALLDYDLSIARRLDARFSRRTIAAKMTDVPGHTIAMVPALATAGIEYLHLGVNDSSRVPFVPALFRWRFGGEEIVVNYAGGYGAATLLDSGVALEFAHSHDNSGPPSTAELDLIFAELRERYPNAEIEAGGLDDFALAVRQCKDSLPVVTAEIGDTWIHGIASDPAKVADFRRLLLLADGWLAAGEPLNEGFWEPMLLVAEHTWGMDTKKFLMDLTHWRKSEFEAARRKNDTTPDLIADPAIRAALMPELVTAHGDFPASSYTRFEASHAEQRNYIRAAIGSLPERLAMQAKMALSWAYPKPDSNATVYRCGTVIQIGDWTATVAQDGTLTRLEQKASGIARDLALGRFRYAVYDGQTVDNCYRAYGRNLEEHFFWAEPDFGKPGLRAGYPELQSKEHPAAVTRIELMDHRLTIFMEGEPALCAAYGCPRRLAMQYVFGEKTIQLTLFWADKDAIRSPEALFFGMDFGVGQPANWRMEKLGAMLDPLAVVPGGARHMHVVERLAYTGADGSLEIRPFDAPLIVLGDAGLYHVEDCPPDISKGFPVSALQQPVGH